MRPADCPPYTPSEVERPAASRPERRSLRRRLVTSIGSGRNSALPTLRRGIDWAAQTFAWQGLALVLGSLLIGTSVTMLVNADFGLSPYDVLMSAVGIQLGISLGQGAWLLAAVLFAVAACFRKYPSAWGLGYLFAIGLAIDGTAHLINEPTTMLGRVLFLLAGIWIMAGGISLVLFSGTTGGPFELLQEAAAERGISRLRSRYALDGGALVLGITLGGSFGVGTVVHACLFGPALVLTAQAFADLAHGRRLRLDHP